MKSSPYLIFVGDAFTFFMIFVMVWLILFFMALPIGIKPEEHPEKGHAVEAPSNPLVARKAGYSALLALVLSVVLYLIFNR